MNYKMIAYILGGVLRVEGLLLLLPTGIAIYYGEDVALRAFLITVAACLLVGFAAKWKEPEDKRI